MAKISAQRQSVKIGLRVLPIVVACGRTDSFPRRPRRVVNQEVSIAIVAFAPRLDEGGNSVKAQKAIAYVTDKLGINLFSARSVGLK